MANKLLSMIKIRQILLFLERGASQRVIEKEVKISRKTIALYLQKVTAGRFFLCVLYSSFLSSNNKFRSFAILFSYLLDFISSKTSFIVNSSDKLVQVLP